MPPCLKISGAHMVSAFGTMSVIHFGIVGHTVPEVGPRAAVVDGLADLHGAAVLARVARGVDEPLTGARTLRERGVVQRDVAAQLSDDRGGRGWLVGRRRGRRQCGHGHTDE